MFDLTLSTFAGEEVLNGEKNWILWNPIVDHGGKGLDKETEIEGKQGLCLQMSCCCSIWKAIVDWCAMHNDGRSWTYGLHGSVHC